MTLEHFIILQIVVALGAFVQTVTGFGLGITFMTGVITFGIFPLEYATIFLVFLSAINVIVTLKGQGIKRDDFTVNRFILIAIPMCLLGVYGLYTSLDYPLAYHSLYALLGVIIILSAISMIVNKNPYATDSPKWAFYGVSAVAGFLGGMFAAPAPPMIYFLHRQPTWDINRIRRTMMLLFTCVLTARVVVTIGIPFPLEFVMWTILSIPAVYLASRVGRTYQDAINITIIKRTTTTILALGGINITWKAYMTILGGQF